MLNRVQRLNHVGIFREATKQGIRLARVALFYGENGRGKSTLSAVLESCGRNKPDLIHCRTTLGEPAANPHVELIFAGGANPVTFDGTWTNPRPEIVVFDSHFVHSNAHTGLQVSTDNRRGLYEFALGEAINDIAELERLDEGLRAANRTRAQHRATLTLIANPFTIEQFVALMPGPNIEAELQAARQRVTANENADRIRERAALEYIGMPELDLDSFFAALSRTVEDMNEDVLQRVREHIAKHRDPRFEQWLGAGHRHGDKPDCPFCGQSTEGVELVEAIGKYFSKQYETLHAETEVWRAAVRSVDSDNVVRAIQNALVRNLALQDAWADVEPVADLVLDLDTTAAEARRLHVLLTGRIDQKATQLLVRVGTPDDRAEAKQLLESLKTRLREYNEQVAARNERYEQRRRETVAGDRNALRAEVTRLEAIARRGSVQVIEAVSQLVESNRASERAAADKENLRNRHDAYMIDLLDRYQAGINGYLDSFRAGFNIRGLMGVHAGGRVPRAHYVIEIRGIGVHLEAQTSRRPSFPTALSDGDRRTLALAFFLARIDLDDRIGEKIVVLDDPMASFDVNRKAQTIRVIENLARRCAQVIVLSHDAIFLREIERTMDGAALHHCAHKIGYAEHAFAQFEGVNLAELCKQPYFQNYELITRYLGGEAPGRINEVAKALRVLIEEFYKLRYPAQFGPMMRLGGMIESIAAANNDSPIATLKPRIVDLDRFNNYASQFHHADPHTVGPQPTEHELRGYAEAALSLIHNDGATARVP